MRICLEPELSLEEQAALQRARSLEQLRQSGEKLFEAASLGDVHAVEEALQQGADPTARNEAGSTSGNSISSSKNYNI